MKYFKNYDQKISIAALNSPPKEFEPNEVIDVVDTLKKGILPYINRYLPRAKQTINQEAKIIPKMIFPALHGAGFVGGLILAKNIFNTTGFQTLELALYAIALFSSKLATMAAEDILYINKLKKMLTEPSIRIAKVNLEEYELLPPDGLKDDKRLKLTKDFYDNIDRIKKDNDLTANEKKQKIHDLTLYKDITGKFFYNDAFKLLEISDQTKNAEGELAPVLLSFGQIVGMKDKGLFDVSDKIISILKEGHEEEFTAFGEIADLDNIYAFTSETFEDLQKLYNLEYNRLKIIAARYAIPLTFSGFAAYQIMQKRKAKTKQEATKSEAQQKEFDKKFDNPKYEGKNLDEILQKKRAERLQASQPKSAIKYN